MVTSLDFLHPIPGEGERQTKQTWTGGFHPRFSYYRRPYLTLRVQANPEDIYFYPLTFLLDTGSPSTYIESKTIAKFGLKDVSKDNRTDISQSESKTGFSGYIEGIKVIVQPSETHQNLKVVGANKYINLLGINVLISKKLTIDRKNNNIEWI